LLLLITSEYEVNVNNFIPDEIIELLFNKR